MTQKYVFEHYKWSRTTVVAKVSQVSFKTDKRHLFQHSKWSRITFGNTCFCGISNPLMVQKRPIFVRIL